MHASLKQVVNLDKTKFDPLLSQGDGFQLKAQPAMTLSETQDLRQNQMFDVAALVSDISEGKPAGATGQHVRDAKLIDQSADGGKVQEVIVGFFHDPTPTREERPMIELMVESKGGKEPLSFFALTGKKTDRGFSVANATELFIVKAICARADELRDAADTLQSTPGPERQVLEQGVPNSRDYSQEQGVQSFCSILL